MKSTPALAESQSSAGRGPGLTRKGCEFLALPLGEHVTLNNSMNLTSCLSPLTYKQDHNTYFRRPSGGLSKLVLVKEVKRCLTRINP